MNRNGIPVDKTDEMIEEALNLFEDARKNRLQIEDRYKFLMGEEQSAASKLADLILRKKNREVHSGR